MQRILSIKDFNGVLGELRESSSFIVTYGPNLEW